MSLRTLNAALLGASLVFTGFDATAKEPKRFATDFQTPTMEIHVSKSGKTVYGFSDITGTLAKVSVEGEGKRPILPLAGRDVACFVSGTRAYAYGAHSGKWAMVEVGEDATPMVSFSRARVETRSRVYLFSSKSEDWAVIDRDDETPADAPPADAKPAKAESVDPAE